MRYELIVKTLAELDITGVVIWHSNQYRNLVVEFLDDIDNCLNFILFDPESCQKCYKNI